MRQRIVGCVALFIMGCSPVEPKPAPKPPTESAPPANSASPAEEPTLLKGKTTLVGVLHEGGVRVCSKPYEDLWVDRTWAVGFVPLVHAAGLSETIAPLEGAVVKVSGVVSDEPTTVHEGDPRPKTTVDCGGLQMRSDWELWPKGTRARRGNGPDLAKLRIESVELVRPFHGEIRDDEVSFSVTNPFEHELQNATLVAHYEGCYGKPGTAVERRPLGAIQAGDTLDDIPVPQLSMRKMARGQAHRLHSVQLIGTVDSGALDLDVKTDTLGLKVECPNRK